MKYGIIRKHDVANGPGVRVSIFVSGCNHACKGCFNQDLWDFDYGDFFTEKEEQEILDAMKPEYIKGLTLLGGEPLELINQRGLLPVVKKAKELYPNKTIWCYTGYLFDKQVRDGMMKRYEETRELMKYIDFIVDGKFILEKRDLTLQFRGSSNQRIIDVQESLKNNSIVIWKDLVK